MENVNYSTTGETIAGLLVLAIMSGCASMGAQAGTGRTADRAPAHAQCPFVAGRYYNFLETASSSIFSDAEYDSISCADNEFCTLSRIFDEETGYHAVVELEQPDPGTIIFRRGTDEIVKTMASGDFDCNAGSISLSESEPGEQDTVRHLTQLTTDQDGSLIARVGLFTPGPDLEMDGPAPLIFAGSAWLRFEGVDEKNRKDWMNPVSIRSYLGSTYTNRSAPTMNDEWHKICEAVNRDRFYSSTPRMEDAWWYQESVWEFSEVWSNSLRQALHVQGIRPDNTIAYMWLELAGKEYRRLLGSGSYSLDTGSEKAALAESMTRTEIERAEQLALAWQPGDCSVADNMDRLADADYLAGSAEQRDRDILG